LTTKAKPRPGGKTTKKRPILQSRHLNVDNVHTLPLADVLLVGLTSGDGDAVSGMIDALHMEIDMCARFNESDGALANLFDLWARRLKVIGALRDREIAERSE
jgi:hypothetical protein